MRLLPVRIIRVPFGAGLGWVLWCDPAGLTVEYGNWN